MEVVKKYSLNNLSEFEFNIILEALEEYKTHSDTAREIIEVMTKK